MDVLGIFTHLRGDDGQWSGWEQDELSRLKTASAAILENQIWEDGVTDDGDPWIVAVDEDSLELSLHVARLSGAYIAVSGDLSPVASSANLKSVVNDCLTYIRSSRQESAANDGAFIRMPIGVSAAAFGILLTERMTAFDEPADRGQTNLHLSELQPDPDESFVFQSSLATIPTPNADAPIAMMPEMAALQGVDQFVQSGLDHDDAEQMIVAERAASDHGAADAEDTSAASLEAETSVTSNLPAPSAAHAEQATDLPAPEAGAAPAEAVQMVEGPGAQMVIAAPQEGVVGEDKINEETDSDQPEAKAAVVAAALPVASEPSSVAALDDPRGGPGDPLLFDLASRDLPPLSSGGEDVLVVADIWSPVDVRDDVFAV